MGAVVGAKFRLSGEMGPVLVGGGTRRSHHN